MTINRRVTGFLVLAVLALILAGGAAGAAAATPQGKVNINTAGADALALLPRVGGVVAQRIIDFRRENGKFTAAEDLMLVQGIGERTFELIEPYVTLEGETTLTEKVKVSGKSTPEDDG